MRLRKPGDFRVPSSCPIYDQYFKHGDEIPEEKCDIHRGPNAAEVIGGIFSRIGKGIGKIFGC